MPARAKNQNQEYSPESPPKFKMMTQSTQSSSQGITQVKKKGEVTQQPLSQDSQNKVKPKKVLSSYLFFTTANVKTIAEKENLTYPEAIKAAAKVWNELDGKGKQQYEKLADQDKVRYEKELKQFIDTGYFTNKDGVCSSTLKAKIKKQKQNFTEVVQEVKPKRPCCPYMFFVKDLSHKVMKENDCKSIAGATVILSQQWRGMNESQKQKYTDQTIQDQIRHKRQIEEMEEKGFFTLEDGTLSSSLKPKIKRVLGKRSQPQGKPVITPVEEESEEEEQPQEESENENQAEEESESEVEVIKPQKKRARKN